MRLHREEARATSILAVGLPNVGKTALMNMCKAAGFYNALLKGDQPAIVVECLNGYRTKEQMPTNIGDYTVQIGKVDKIKSGEDITIISYGSTLKIVEKASEELQKFNITTLN